MNPTKVLSILLICLKKTFAWVRTLFTCGTVPMEEPGTFEQEGFSDPSSSSKNKPDSSSTFYLYEDSSLLEFIMNYRWYLPVLFLDHFPLEFPTVQPFLGPLLPNSAHLHLVLKTILKSDERLEMEMILSVVCSPPIRGSCLCSINRDSFGLDPTFCTCSGVMLPHPKTKN